MKETKKIYFGHLVDTYDTDIESVLVKKINEHFPDFEVENPNQKHHHAGYIKWKANIGDGMHYYFTYVLPKMDVGIFLAFDDRMFGAGVYGEAEFMHKRNCPIYEITRESKITELVLDPKRFLSIKETQKRIYNKQVN